MRYESWFRHLAGALALITCNSAHGVLFRVGADAACQYNSPATAIAAAQANGSGVDQILLSGDFSGVALIIDTPLELRGGYANCSAPNPTGRSQLTGTDGLSPVLDIVSAEVTLSGLHVQGANSLPPRVLYGGGIAITNAVTYLSDSEISNAVAKLGGGIAVVGHNSVLVIYDDVEIHHNYAYEGGGIYVGEALLRASYKNLSIHHNSAERNSQTLEGGHGGGIYVTGASGWAADVVIASYEALEPIVGARISDNYARSGGGGIYVTTNASASTYETAIERNSTDGVGGGVMVYSDGNFSLARRESIANIFVKNCTSTCARISDNFAQEGGGAVMTMVGATSVRQAQVIGNSSNHGGSAFHFGSIANATRTNSLVLDGVVVAKNNCNVGTNASRPCAVYSTVNSDSIELRHVTQVNNRLANTPVADFRFNGNEHLSIVNSILIPDALSSNIIFGSYAAGPIDCNLYSRGMLGNRPITGTATFINAAANDYRLSTSSTLSAGIDTCDASFLGEPDTWYSDPLLMSRGQNLPNVGANSGTLHDVGAYEAMPSLPFGDGFED
ncbi:MAG: hypothetical protein IT475_16660 [Aquimonas sp.]|nr:hypothetical protein [Aquimonas sp.]